MSAQIDDGGLAFPSPVEFDPNGQLVSHGSFGMTLRDWFAGQALAGMLSAVPSDAPRIDVQHFAGLAYAAADALLSARKDTQ